MRIGMRQTDIAKHLQISQGQVSRFFSGKGGLRWENVKKLSELLGRSPSWWMDASSEQREAVRKNGDGCKKTG